MGENTIPITVSRWSFNLLTPQIYLLSNTCLGTMKIDSASDGASQGLPFQTSGWTPKSRPTGKAQCPH